MSFRTYCPRFETLLGSDPKLELLLEKKYPFAHEAGVFFDNENVLFVTSNRLIENCGNQRVQISRVQIGENAGTTTCEAITCNNIEMANGGVNHQGGILFCAQGSHTSPSGLYQTSRAHPYNAELLISDFYGRPFNSVNDVVVHSDRSIWFTDPAYGYEQGYRPQPRLPSQVYRFQVPDRSIRAMADGFGHPNGICFSPDENVVYITDTDWISGNGTTDDTKASSIYAFDVSIASGQPFLTNKRLFAMCDTGVPDGIKCDMEGNVYSGCGDGINVWSSGGILLGKVLVEGGIANFCFGRSGEMFLLNETRLWKVSLDKKVRGALLQL